MLRCPRCRTNDRTLLRFGVYLCPACGETDPDGVALVGGDVQAPAVAATAQPVVTAASAFAPPPKAAYAAPGATEALTSHPSGPPSILMLTIGGILLLDLVNLALSDRSGCSLSVMGIEVALLIAVLSGSAWARGIGLLLGAFNVLMAGVVFLIAGQLHDAHMVTLLRVSGGVTVAINAFWIYVLFRADVTNYFVGKALR